MSTRPRCYLDTSVLRGLGDAALGRLLADTSDFQPIVSALAICELVSAVVDSSFVSVRAGLRRALYSRSVLHDGRFPEAIVADAFGVDLDGGQFASLQRLAFEIANADSHEAFQAVEQSLLASRTICYGSDCFHDEEARLNVRFVSATAAGAQKLREELRHAEPEEIEVGGITIRPKAIREDFAVNGGLFPINVRVSVLALAADLAGRVLRGCHESPIWNADTKRLYDAYMGDIDIYCAALAHYNFPPLGSREQAKRNDVIDLKHFLYLGGAASCDALVTRDQGQFAIGSLVAPGRVFLVDSTGKLAAVHGQSVAAERPSPY